MSAPATTDLIDRVDTTDQAIGTIERGRALVAGVNFRTAHVLIENANGDVLLQRLSPRRSRHSGRWGSSVAAYLHAGETYEAAARRRMNEELGLVVPLDPLGKLGIKDEASTKFVVVFGARSDRADNLEPDHIAELRFWDRTELRRTLAIEPERFTPTLVAAAPLIDQ